MFSLSPTEIFFSCGTVLFSLENNRRNGNYQLSVTNVLIGSALLDFNQNKNSNFITLENDLINYARFLEIPSGSLHYQKIKFIISSITFVDSILLNKVILFSDLNDIEYDSFSFFWNNNLASIRDVRIVLTFVVYYSMLKLIFSDYPFQKVPKNAFNVKLKFNIIKEKQGGKMRENPHLNVFHITGRSS